MLTFQGEAGNVYHLNKNLGEGGEGIVFDLLYDDKHVAKVYKANHFKMKSERDTMERKLKTMMSMKLTGYVNNLLMFTWPIDILYSDGEMVGFVMPKIQTDLKIYSVYRMGADVKKAYPFFTWKYSVQFAYNLSWVVQFLHSKGIVVGDFNQNNICVDTKTGAVILIDCDSFDITDSKTGEHFPCTVGFSEVLAPELQGVGELKNGHFTKESDNFSLAIHIFRLLMRNADPFGGIIAFGSSSSSTSQNRAIVNGECQYIRDVGKKIPEWSPKLKAMPPEVQKLFKRTFDYSAITALRRRTNRATAEEWCSALLPYAKVEPNYKLKKCMFNSLHVYPAHNWVCPWCECEGIDHDAELLKRFLLYTSKAMCILILLSVLGELLILCYAILSYHVQIQNITKNLMQLKITFCMNPLVYIIDVLQKNISRISFNFEESGILHQSIILRVTHASDNNSIIINCLKEQLQNIFLVMPVITERIRSILFLLGSNHEMLWHVIVKKISKAIYEGGR